MVVHDAVQGLTPPKTSVVTCSTSTRSAGQVAATDARSNDAARLGLQNKMYSSRRGCAGRQQRGKLLKEAGLCVPAPQKADLQRGRQHRHCAKAALLGLQQAQSWPTQALGCLHVHARSLCAAVRCGFAWRLQCLPPMQSGEVGQRGVKAHEESACIRPVAHLRIMCSQDNVQGSEFLALADGVLYFNPSLARICIEDQTGNQTLQLRRYLQIGACRASSIIELTEAVSQVQAI